MTASAPGPPCGPRCSDHSGLFLDTLHQFGHHVGGAALQDLRPLSLGRRRERQDAATRRRLLGGQPQIREGQLAVFGDGGNVVVTGATSGIGRAVTEQLLDRGARVVELDAVGIRLKI